jgi:hypothetical protein
LSDIFGKYCAAVLSQGWIARYGVSAVITSNLGSQFTSALWDSLCNILGIWHMQTTAYHPQSNSLVEHFHQRLKDTLRASLASPTWTTYLPWVLHFSHSICFSAHPLLCLANFWMKMQILMSLIFKKNFSQAVGAVAIIPTMHNVDRAQRAPEDLPANLLRAEAVLVRCDGHVLPLEPFYNGPYRVLTRSCNFFRLQIGGRTDTVSTGRFKPCLDPAAAPVASPR